MKRLLITALLAAPLSAQTSAPFIPAGQGWHDLGANTQLQVSAGVNPSLAICPANNYGGSGYNFTSQCDNVFFAWNSGALDDSDEYMLLCAQGGHTDYQGGECYALEYGTTTPSLVRLNNPTLPISSNNPSFGYIPDNGGASTNCVSTTQVSGANVCPNARHTYDGVEFIPSTGELMLEAGAVGPNGPLRAIDNWTFNVSALTWTRRDNCGNGLVGQTCTGQTRPGSAGETVDLSTMAYNSADGKIYYINPYNNDLWSYVPSTHLWAKLASNVLPGGYAEYMVTTVDPANNNLIAIQAQNGGQIIDKINLSTFSATDVTSSCSLAANFTPAGTGSAPGVTYDSARKQIVVFPPNLGNTIYVINPSTFSCTSETYSTGNGNSTINGPADPTNGGTFSSLMLGKRAAYSAKEDAFIVMGGPFQHAYALRRTTFAASDFVNRCAAAGVTLCQNFDTSAAYTHSGNYPTVSPTVRYSNQNSGVQEIFQDTATVASGTSSMRIDCPPQSGSYSDCSGGWFTWLGPSQIYFGPNDGNGNYAQDLWMQFRWRINSQLAKTDWESLVGSSPKHFDMYNVQAGSCSSEELTMIRQGNAGLNGFLDVYGGCGGWGYVSQGSSATTSNEGATWAPDGAVSNAFYESSNLAYNNGGNGCIYSSYAAPCAYEKNIADQWLTVQVHIHFTSWDANPTIGSGTNTLDMWIAPVGGTLALWKHFPATAFFQQQGSGYKGFDTLLFEDYMTSASCTGSCLTSWTTTASQWVDELLISTQQPAVPMGAGTSGTSQPVVAPATNLFAQVN